MAEMRLVKTNDASGLARGRTHTAVAAVVMAALVFAGSASAAGTYDPPTVVPPTPSRPTSNLIPTRSPTLASAPAYGQQCRVTGGAKLPAAPTAGRAWTARLVGVTGLRTRPVIRRKPFRYLRPYAPLGGGDVNLLITGRACDAHDRAWLRVYVPQRPNGSQAWILRDYVVISRNEYRVVIDQSDRTLTLFRRGHRIWRTQVAVGKAETPTPFGKFAIAEKVRTGDPKNFLGPLVMPLTAFSETLNEYAGGNGRVAIHGTSFPQLIGTRASHGCIRMRNKDVTRLGRILRPGTPVTIKR